MASNDAVGGEQSSVAETNVGFTEPSFSPKLLKSEVENYWKYQLNDTKVGCVRYPSTVKSDSETTNVTEGEVEDLICEVLNGLQRPNQVSKDFIVIHSYSHLKASKPIHETDFLVLSKTHGIFHLEQKGYDPHAAHVLLPTKPVCIRGAVLMACDQIEKRTEAIESIIRSDHQYVGSKFGVSAKMVDELIQRLKLCNRACVIPQNDSTIDVTQLCKRADRKCQKCDSEWYYAPIDDSCARIFGKRNKLKDNLRQFFKDRLSQEPLFSDRSEQENMFMLLLRRFVVLKMQCRLPKLKRSDVDGMDSKIIKGVRILRTELAMENATESILLSADQLKVLHLSDSKLFISGPAGSGKTVLLLLKAEQLIQQSFSTHNVSHNQLLIVCYTKGITMFIEQCLSGRYGDIKTQADQDLGGSGSLSMPTFNEFATVTTYTKFLVDFCNAQDFYQMDTPMSRKALRVAKIVRKLINEPPDRRFSHILLDECQDFFGKWPPLFDLFLTPAVANIPQCLWRFYDCNLIMWNGAMKKSRPTENPDVTLTKVFRSTINIHNFAAVFAEFDDEVQVAHAINGPQVHLDCSVYKSEFDSELSEQDLNAAVTHIHANVMKGIEADFGKRKRSGEFPKDTLDNIVALVRNKTWADQITEKLIVAGENRNALKVVNAETIRELEKDEIRLESVGRFKGLESRVILWFEPDVTFNEPQDVYSAATRATTALVIITSEESKDFILGKSSLTGKTPDFLMFP